MESPRGTRILQIVLGGIAIALSLGVIFNPGIGIATLALLLSVTLLVVGIERVVTGLTQSNRSKLSKFGNISLGALVALIGIAVLAFPVFATEGTSYTAGSWLAFHRNCKNHSRSNRQEYFKMVQGITCRSRDIISGCIICGLCISIIRRIVFDASIGNKPPDNRSTKRCLCNIWP